MGIDIINSPFIHNINLGIYIDINLLFKNIMLKTNVCLKIRENSGRQTIEPRTMRFSTIRGVREFCFCAVGVKDLFSVNSILKCKNVQG